jgi:hypothetical protein
MRFQVLSRWKHPACDNMPVSNEIILTGPTPHEAGSCTQSSLVKELLNWCCRQGKLIDACHGISTITDLAAWLHWARGRIFAVSFYVWRTPGICPATSSGETF